MCTFAVGLRFETNLGLKHHKIIFSFLLFSILTFVSYAERGAMTQRKQLSWQDSLGDTVDLDSVIQDSLVSSIQAKVKNVDSLINKNDSDHQVLSYLDSLKAVYSSQKGEGRATQWNDSVARVEDSLKHVKKSPLDAPVEFKAEDSLVFIMDTKDAFLFGNSDVKYTNIQLTAEEIKMNMDSNIVHAIGATDSLGKKFGEPVFKEGSDTYECESMSYNFKSKKGFISNVYTAQQDGFLTSEESKKGENDELYLRHGRYTTCDEPHPHFYIALSRAKVHTGKSVFSGPAWLVIEDVPLPLAIPYAYFPFTSSYSSGLIMPTYGDESTRGFYLRDGGYYFAISDIMDLKLTGEIYTKGSWGIGGQTAYKKRYKYGGNFYFNYQVTKEGEENMPDYNVSKNFKIQWTHRQDPKASPNSSFSASVNFTTQSYEKKNLSSLYNPASYSQSTRTSSVSYSRSFPKQGLSVSSSMNVSQNMRDSSIALTLPSLNVSLSRIYPFKRKHAVGKERWYEKISMSYSGSLSNSINTKEDKLMSSNLAKDWKNGIQHSIPVSATFSVFNYINIVPQMNYSERWYTYKTERHWDKDQRREVADTIYGFNRVWDYNLSLSANTTVYGFYKPLPIFGKKVEVIRHVITPSVSYSYAPDFSSDKYGYYGHYVKTDEEGNVSTVSYSKYASNLYGAPGGGKTGSISLDLSNNIEAKYKDKNDSIKKFSIVDELGASISYNLAAKQQPWSNLSTRLRLKWKKTTFNINAVFYTYAYEFDKNGNVIVGNTTEWSHGRFGRFQGMSKNLSYTFNNQTLRNIKKKINKLRGIEDEDENKDSKEGKDEKNEDENNNETNLDSTHDLGRGQSAESPDGLDADGYMKFTMPWSFTVSYGISMAEDRSAQINVKTMRYPYKFTQNMNFSGNLKLSSNWNINFSSGWDFNAHKLSMTTANISRDMHCFNISCGLTFGIFTSYNVTMRAKASTLTDALKYDKKSSYSSSIKWY